MERTLDSKRLLSSACGNDRVAIRLEGAYDEPLVDRNEEAPTLELASDEPASGVRILGGDDPTDQGMRAQPRKADVPLAEGCVEASHPNIAGKTIQSKSAKRSIQILRSGRCVKRARTRQPSKGGCRGAVLYHRCANASRSEALQPGKGASTSKRKVWRSPERQGGLSTTFSSTHTKPSK
eukprot:CAMPEP_0115188572 /NCGR_PEP_ID=MMETSP0270-20121206/11080_1 /TAXON_ID=71861 /ORGANISM="Scrippsiella trochoidea, Strain CCMP3099" /LENGTH=179 /DNA_ID=CAMNT_0002601759 /DNA_START=178 /DNA_END=718 /DNA_ORIENTATION=+